MNLIFKLAQVLLLLLSFGFFFLLSTTQANSQEVLESKQFKLFLLEDSEKDLISPTPKPIRYSLSKQEYDEFQKNGLITRPLGEQKKLQVQFGSLSTQLNHDDTYKDIAIRSISEVTTKTQSPQGNPIQVLYKYEHGKSTYINNLLPSNSFFLGFLRKSAQQIEKLSKDTLYVFIQNPYE